jgi:molybdenum cofactor cytidylyltransferase
VSSNLDRPAVMIALGDEPRVDRGLVMQVMQLWHETRAPIVVPRYNGDPGHPVLFDEKTYDRLMELRGDRGARSMIESDDRVLSVEVQSQRPIDVDTAKDLERL